MNYSTHVRVEIVHISGVWKLFETASVIINPPGRIWYGQTCLMILHALTQTWVALARLSKHVHVWLIHYSELCCLLNHIDAKLRFVCVCVCLCVSVCVSCVCVCLCVCVCVCVCLCVCVCQHHSLLLHAQPLSPRSWLWLHPQGTMPTTLRSPALRVTARYGCTHTRGDLLSLVLCHARPYPMTNTVNIKLSDSL